MLLPLVFFCAPKETDIKWICRCCCLSFSNTRWNVALGKAAPALKLRGDGWGYKPAPCVGRTCLQELANPFNSALNPPLRITECFVSVCHCNTSPCFCSCVLSSNFGVASGWLQWSFFFGSCRSQTSPGWQTKQIGLRRKSHPFLLPSVPDSASWLISTEKIFLNMFFTFNHGLDLMFPENISKIQSDRKKFPFGE